jgi:hypothetical protein
MDLQEYIIRLIIAANALERDGLHGSARALADLARQAKNAQKCLETTPSDSRKHFAGHG